MALTAGSLLNTFRAMKRVASLAVLGAVPFSAASASAQTICVPAMAAGCDSATASLQQALDQANTSPGGNTVRIAAMTYEPTGGCTSGSTYESFSYPTSIVGAGTGKTILTCEANYNQGGSYSRVLSVSGPVTVSNLTIALPAGIQDRGLELGSGAIAQDITLTSDPTATSALGVIVDDGKLQDSSVSVNPSDATDEAIQAVEGNLSRDTVTSGGFGIDADDGTVIRQAIVTAAQGVTTDHGQATIDDSLIDVVSSHPQPYGLAATSTNGPLVLALTARSVTIVGGGQSAAGAVSEAENPGQQTTLTLSNSVISGPAIPLERSSATGNNAFSDITASYDDYPAANSISSGPGSISQAHILSTTPGFLNPTMGVYQLAPGSPLIDAGTPGPLASGEPTTDLAGNPRILASRGTCTARRDIGAYEYAPGHLPAPATASAHVTAVGKAITFRGAGCSIDPQLKPRFTWSFGDGSKGAGPTVKHAFKHQGTYHVTLTVRDVAGRRGQARLTVTVRRRRRG